PCHLPMAAGFPELPESPAKPPEPEPPHSCQPAEAGLPARTRRRVGDRHSLFLKIVLPEATLGAFLLRLGALMGKDLLNALDRLGTGHHAQPEVVVHNKVKVFAKG